MMENQTVIIGSLITLLLIKRRQLMKKKSKRPKRFWVHPIFLQRKQHGHFHNLLQEMRLSDESMFFNYTRMTPASFDKLLGLVGPIITKYSLREAIPPGCRLSITLRFLATGDSYPSLSYAFRVGVTTVCNIIRETCKALWEVLCPLVLKMPDQEKQKNTADEFCHRWSLPNCIGAIDGKHVIIQAPQNSGSTFYNYKKSFSVILLAVCDANYCFSYVDIGAYGAQSDGGVLNQSSFGKKLLSGELHVPSPSVLPGDSENLPFPFYFVGDEAFPLRVNLMRPYSKVRNGPMPQEERIFNYRLSRARRMIENTFGILVARFRIFHRVINAAPETVDNIVKATVCLHNYIRSENNRLYLQDNDVDREVDGVVIPGQWRNEVPQAGTALQVLSGRLGARNASQLAAFTRDYLKQYVNADGSYMAPWQWDYVNKTN